MREITGKKLSPLSEGALPSRGERERERGRDRERQRDRKRRKQTERQRFDQCSRSIAAHKFSLQMH